MPIGYTKLSKLIPVNGIRLASVAAGVRYKDRIDLVLMELAQQSQCAAVFTQNAFCAAPVIIAKKNLSEASPRYLLINSGNANAGTGERGIADSQSCCESVAKHARLNANQVLPFSTGVIGEHLPVDRIEAGVSQAINKLEQDAWQDAAHGIMTTDTLAKGVSKTLTLDGGEITITGICKGAGMIRPDMATMLAFIATDAKLDGSALQDCLASAVEASFNRITVDGDTSTNDACVLVATGCSEVGELKAGSDNHWQFCEAVSDVCKELAQLIIRDAEGATKFVTIDVDEAASSQECLQVAYTVAHSPLVKTALFASDPNWGRILAAVGRAGVSELDIQAIQIYLDDVCIVRNGAVAEDYLEEHGQRVMSQEEITIRIVLGRGKHREQVWTSDLSNEYVRINAEYRT